MSAWFRRCVHGIAERTIRLFFEETDVCQNPCAVFFGRYNGELVRLVPVCEDAANPVRITQWVPDPDMVSIIDRRMADAVKPTCSVIPVTASETTEDGYGGSEFDPTSVPGL